MRTSSILLLFSFCCFLFTVTCLETLDTTDTNNENVSESTTTETEESISASDNTDDEATTLVYGEPYNVDSEVYGSFNYPAPYSLFVGSANHPCKVCQLDCLERGYEIFASCQYRFIRYSCKRDQYCLSTRNLSPGEFYGSIAMCIVFNGCVLRPELNSIPALSDKNEFNQLINYPTHCATKEWYNYWGCMQRLGTRRQETDNKYLTISTNPETWNPEWWREWQKHRMLLNPSSDPLHPGPQIISDCFFVYFKIAVDLKLLADAGTFGYPFSDPAMRGYLNYMNTKLERIPGAFRNEWKCHPLNWHQQSALISQIRLSGKTRFHVFFERLQACIGATENTAASTMFWRYYGRWDIFYGSVSAANDNCASGNGAMVRNWNGGDLRPGQDLVTDVMLAGPTA